MVLKHEYKLESPGELVGAPELMICQGTWWGEAAREFAISDRISGPGNAIVLEPLSENHQSR